MKEASTELDQKTDGRTTVSDAERRRRSEQMTAINAGKKQKREAKANPKCATGIFAGSLQPENATMSEFPSRTDWRKDVEWVYHELGAESGRVPPSPGARALLKWAKKSPHEFFRTFVPRFAGTGDDEESKLERRRERQDAMALDACREMLMRFKEEAERGGAETHI
jgi:hypothetical protein